MKAGRAVSLHTSLSDFIIISEASAAARRTRRLPLCCVAQKRAVITGAESPSCPLAGSR